MNKKIYSVSELSFFIKNIFEQNAVLSNLWVRGEITNFKKHSSGHLYFSLKDQNSNMRVVMFKGRAGSLQFTPRDGLDCLVRGYILFILKRLLCSFTPKK